MRADKDLDLVVTGLPLVGFRFPVRIPPAGRGPVPWFGFVVNELASPVPQRRPLRAFDHTHVAEQCVEVAHRVLEQGGRIDGHKSVFGHLQCLRDLQWAKDDIEVRRGCAGELNLHSQGNARCGADGGGVCFRRGVRNSGRGRDRRGQADGGRARDGWRQRLRGGGGVEAVGDRFGKTVQEEGEQRQDGCGKNQTPTGHLAVAAHTEEFERSGAAQPAPRGYEAQGNADERQRQGGLDAGMDIQAFENHKT